MDTNTGYFPYFNEHERKLLPKGIDISAYQYPTEPSTFYDGLIQDGIDFVIHRASRSLVTNIVSEIDSQFTSTNINYLREKGIRVGTYMYTRPANIYTSGSYTGGYTETNLQNHAILEANYYADHLESVFGSGECGDILPAIDFEDSQMHTYKMTPNEAYVYLKAFNDRMIVRFPQLSSRGGCLLYTAWYFVDDACNGDIQATAGEYINVQIPNFWLTASAGDNFAHSGGGISSPATSYNQTAFGGYTTYNVWQYQTDRVRFGQKYGTATTAIDMNVVDTYNNDYNDMLVVPVTRPKGQQVLLDKAHKRHTHIGEYLPTINGQIMGKTLITSPTGFYQKQENQVSWKVGGRKDTTYLSANTNDDLVFYPSTSNYEPFNSVEAEDFDSTKGVVFKKTGDIQLKGTDTVLTDADFGTSAGEVAEGNHTHTESQVTDLDKYSQSQVDTLLDAKPDITADETITGQYYFSNGFTAKNNVVASVGNEVKYLRLARLKFPSDFGRVYAKLNVVHTGTNLRLGTLAIMGYESSVGTIHASAEFNVINDTGFTSKDFSAGNVKYQQWSTAGNTTDFIDIWIEMSIYSTVSFSVDVFHKEVSADLEFDPDSGTTQTSIPVATSTDTYDGESVTAQDSGTNFTIKTITMT